MTDATSSTTASTATVKKFTRQELQAHNHQDDALFVINNVVYDVTKFLGEHPGGADALLDSAGRDATTSFYDVGHTEDAIQLSKKYAVGEVVDEDRWENRKSQANIEGPTESLSLSAMIRMWGPPLALAVVAIVLYMNVFV